jgi:integrase
MMTRSARLASFLVRKGTDVKTVQRLLRHSDVTTTLGHLRSQHERGQADRAGRYAGGDDETAVRLGELSAYK